MQSESTAAIAAALAKAQGAIKPATFDGEAKTGTYGYKYATLTALWSVARDALAANGLAVTQTTDVDGNGNILLVTTLMHSSGEWVGGVFPVRVADSKPQTLGSAMTYARRYALGALLGLTADDDDDGNAANGNNAGGASRQNGSSNGGGAATAKRQPANVNTPAAAAPEHDNPFTSDEAALIRKLNAVGGDLYRDKWTDDKRHELVSQLTKGRTSSSKQLTAQELENLIAWMNSKIDERNKAKVAA